MLHMFARYLSLGMVNRNCAHYALVTFCVSLLVSDGHTKRHGPTAILFNENDSIQTRILQQVPTEQQVAIWVLDDRVSPGPVFPGVLQRVTNGTGEEYLYTSETCKSIGEVLDSIPETSRYRQLLLAAGMRNILMNDPKVQTTLLVPVDDAFATPLESPTEYGTNMNVLIQNRPDVINSLVGASVLQGIWPSSSLTPGMKIPTSNTIDKVNPLYVEVIGRGEPSIKSQGSVSNFITSDIAACGPSVIHLVDSIVLPFSFNDGSPRDPILLTKPSDQNSNPPFRWTQLFG
jgi:hypothetical protein